MTSRSKTMTTPQEKMKGLLGEIGKALVAISEDLDENEMINPETLETFFSLVGSLMWMSGGLSVAHLMAAEKEDLIKIAH